MKIRWTSTLSYVAAILFCLPVAARAQGIATAPPQLSPQAAYEHAVHPFDIVRDDTANWSDAEKTALGVAMSEALHECDARDPKQYGPNDLLAYLRLCTFGWDWSAVQTGAWLYINAQKREGSAALGYTIPGLTQAYAYEIKASLSQNDDIEAALCSDRMLSEVPYTDLVSQATGATIRYQQMLRTNQARSLLAKRYLLLLDMLHKRTTAAPGATPDPNVAPQPSGPALHTLYADALQWPAMMQFNKSFGWESIVADLDKALPATLPNDDAILIDLTRKQFKLFGAPLPALDPVAYLAGPTFAVPPSTGKDFGTASVFFLFPDWCAQCVRKGADLTKAAARLNPKGVRVYGVVAQDGPAPKPPVPAAKAVPGKTKPAPAVTVLPRGLTPVEVLTESPTLVIPKATLKQFITNDVPLLVVTDGEGKIRFLQQAPDNALEEHSLVDQVVERVLQQWPSAAKE